jgi:superfamily II DNA or RNA helicase
MGEFEDLQQTLHTRSICSSRADSGDGLFDRLRQILNVSLSIGRLQSPLDAMALFRHVLRRESLIRHRQVQLRVPSGADWPSRKSWTFFGVQAHSEANGHCLIEAREWRPDWLDDCDKPVFEDVFAERNVRLDWRQPIDPFLRDVSGFETYVSRGQREAVRSALLLPPGETLIVALPTGSGKSFVAQGPVLTRGIEGGLSICVVPTIALALDQARQMRQMLKRQFPRAEMPQLAWRADLRKEERAAIKLAIREGRQGILYCSPEAVTGALLPALYDAAKAGLISYLIIDEAHLVAQWGDSFRPAFQMLAGVRRGLLAQCPPHAKFKTLLMSATMSTETVGMLGALFGPKIQMVASVHLRPEPQYWIHREDDQREKDRKVLEVLRHAPRPFILYVTKRSDAKRWLSLLRGMGYERVDCFHGETADRDRLRIIEQWSENRLDGIVATSAFGVGIDKRDVRTVIHAAVPETVDRFYQEVGRGGRDGCPSASFLIYSSEDQAAAHQIASPTLISDDLAFERWSTMVDGSTKLDAFGQLLKVDLAAVPPRLRRQSDYNQSWNMRTLIMMARAGMLTLESMAPSHVTREEDEIESVFDRRTEEYWAKYYQHAVVRMNEFGHLNRVWFEDNIGQERLRAFDAATENRKLLDELLSGSIEVSAILDHLYRSNAPGRTVAVSKACGGCPEGRRHESSNIGYAAPPAYGIEHVGTVVLSAFEKRFPQLRLDQPIILPVKEPLDDLTFIILLKDFVEMFSVREIATSAEFRLRNPALSKLHLQSGERVLLLQTVEEEEQWPSSYELPRVTLWTVSAGSSLPKRLFSMKRPLHVIITPESTLDPWNGERRIADTGQNVLTIDEFKLGVRM